MTIKLIKAARIEHCAGEKLTVPEAEGLILLSCGLAEEVKTEGTPEEKPKTTTKRKTTKKSEE